MIVADSLFLIFAIVDGIGFAIRASLFRGLEIIGIYPAAFGVCSVRVLF